jgi:hypothetical protein
METNVMSHEDSRDQKKTNNLIKCNVLNEIIFFLIEF